MLKSIIIEDETKTRESLEYLLNKYCPEVKICAIADNFQSGYELARKEKPSLLFIDIQLNSLEGTGIDLINALDLSGCAVVFISGYKEYAVEAFRVKAVDYLLKPVSIHHLIEAVEKAKKYLSTLKSATIPDVRGNNSGTFHIPTQNGFIIIRQADIIRCEADGAYTHFYVKGKNERITSSVNIGQVEQKLNSNFLRVHKSHIINKEFVFSYSKGEGLIVKMFDHAEVPVSRNMKESFYAWLA